MSDKPAFPQVEKWQNDMEKHVADPKSYGPPSLEGIGLTKRELFAAMIMQGFAANSCAKDSLENRAAFAVKSADVLIKTLESK